MSDSPTPPTSARLINLAGHELRTPASVVIGYLRMLLAEHPGPLTDRQRKMLSEAEHSSQRMNRIIAEMSELSNLQAGGLTLASQRIQIAELLHEAVDAVGPLDGPGATGGFSLRIGDAAAIMADPLRLRIGLTAILHAMARERRDPTAIVADSRIEAVDGRRMALVRIGAEEALPLLGGPRGEFDRWRGGLGLSLPIAQLVIEAADGTIWSPEGPASHAATGLAFPVAE